MLRAAIVLASLAATGAAHAAEGAVSARYEISFMGLAIGEAELKARGQDDRYAISLSAKVTGLAAVFAGGQGQSAAEGRVVGREARPVQFTLDTQSKDKATSVALAFSGGAVTSTRLVPNEPVPSDVEPVTADHLRGGVVDILSGALFIAPASGEVVAPATCERRAKVFTGKERLDVVFSYGRTEQVKLPGYEGEALVCAMRFEPISGYAKGRRDIQAMRSRVGEVTLLPIKGARTLVPARVVVPFALGKGIAQATEIAQK